MIELYQSVELTWGAPDLALYESFPHSVRIHSGDAPSRDDGWTEEQYRAHMRRLGKMNGKPLMYRGRKFSSMRDAANYFGCSRHKVAWAVSHAYEGCHYL